MENYKDNEIVLAITKSGVIYSTDGYDDLEPYSMGKEYIKKVTEIKEIEDLMLIIRRKDVEALVKKNSKCFRKFEDFKESVDYMENALREMLEIEIYDKLENELGIGTVYNIENKNSFIHILHNMLINYVAEDARGYYVK